MKKTAILAAAGALALAGCGGGDDDNQALSYSDFGDAANAICQKAETELSPLEAKFTGQASQDAALYDEAVPKLESLGNEFAALDPPAELQDVFDEYNTLRERDLENTKEAQQLADAGDQKGYVTFIKETPSVSADLDLAASKLGAADCINAD